MTLALADFLVSFPEFVTTDPDRIDFMQRKLDEAARRINFTYLDPRGDDAHGYLAAHLIASSPSTSGGGGIGQIASIHAGQVTVTYANPSGATASALESTSYGSEYLAILKLSGPGMTLL